MLIMLACIPNAPCMLHSVGSSVSWGSTKKRFFGWDMPYFSHACGYLSTSHLKKRWKDEEIIIPLQYYLLVVPNACRIEVQTLCTEYTFNNNATWGCHHAAWHTGV
jgi:hypothetical protein